MMLCYPVPVLVDVLSHVALAIFLRVVAVALKGRRNRYASLIGLANVVVMAISDQFVPRDNFAALLVGV